VKVAFCKGSWLTSKELSSMNFTQLGQAIQYNMSLLDKKAVAACIDELRRRDALILQLANQIRNFR